MIEQIRLIHKAFEDEPNHIATYVPTISITTSIPCLAAISSS